MGSPRIPPPSEFSYASHGITPAFLKPLALILLFVFAGLGNVWGETIYNETFGEGANNVVVTSFSGWSVSGVTYSGDAKVGQNTNNACGLSGSSKKGYVYMSSANIKQLIISGINTLDYSSIELSYNYKGASTSSKYKVEYSTDGTNYTSLSTNNSCKTTWQSKTESTKLPATSNLRLRFTNTATNYSVYFDDIKITGTATVSCSNKVTISKGTESHGTFTLNKTGEQDACDALSVTITPSPADHYHVASVSATDPASTGTAGTAVDNGDGTWTITYSANAKGASTVNVTFEADLQYTVKWYVNGSVAHLQTGYEGATLTDIPTPTSNDCDGSKVFVGWYTNTYSHASTAPAFVSPTTIPNGGANYYAVFAEESISEGGSKTLTINGNNAGNTYESADRTIDEVTIKATNKWGKQQNGNAYYAQIKTNGVIYNNEALGGYIKSIAITQYGGEGEISVGTTRQPTSNNTNITSTQLNFTKEQNYKYFAIKSTSTLQLTSVVITYSSASTVYTNYATSCCEALGQISGSVNLSDEEQRSITVNWTRPTTESDVDHYELSYKVKGSTDEPTVKNNITNTNGSYTVSGLACSTTYEFILKAVGDASHCDYTSAVVEGTTLDALTLPALSYPTGLIAGGANINPIWATTPAHDGTVTYASSNPSVLQVVNASTGEVKPVGAGDATITATYAETASNCEASQTSNMVSVSGNVSVSFNANGGSGEMSNQSIQYNTATALTANGFTAPSTCQYFYGWATSQENANNEVRAYKENESVTITEGMELWAIWKTYNYTVTKGTNTGAATFDLSATSVDCGGSITVTATPDAMHKGEPTITITPSNAGTVNGNTIENITANITAVDVSYAAKENYSVTWSVNGETVSKDFSEGTTFAEIMADASKPAVADNAIETNCEANKFMGWATAVVTKDNAESGDVAWFDGNAILSDAQTFYAVWAKEEGSENTAIFNATTEAGLTEDDTYWSWTHNASGITLDISNGNQYTDGTPNTFTVTAGTSNYIAIKADGKTITGVTVTTTIDKNNSSKHYKPGSVSSGILGDATVNGDYEDYAITGTITSPLNIYATTNQMRVVEIKVNYSSISRTNYQTNCCALKAATGIELGAVTANSVTLNWTAPSSTDGITKLQVVDGNDVVKVDGLAANATTATINDLTECAEYTFRVVSVGAECNALSEAVTAKPYGSAKVVTFVHNDGVTANIVEATTCTVNTVNVPSTPSRDGYRFMGWFNGESEVTGETFTPAETTTIEARWAQLFTVHYDFAGATFGEAPEDVQYIAGEEVTLTDVVPNKGVLAPFKVWSYSTDVEVVAGKFNMPASDLTITATYDEIVGQWILVTDESTLNEGDYIVIAAAGSNKAMKTTQNGTSYRNITDITKSGNTISTPSNDVQIFVLEEGTVADSWAFKCLNGDYKDKYIYANSNSSNNTMNSQATNDANGLWKLNLVGGYATAQGTNKKKVLQYNSDRFACYETASQSAIAFYQFREGTFYEINVPEEVTGGSVNANPTMAKAGETVTLTYAPSRGYTVKTLTVTGASGSVAISPVLAAGTTEYTFTMPAEAVTIAASFEAVPPVEYMLVENASDIAMGMQFVMLGTKADGTEPYVIGEINNSNRLAGDAVEASAIDAVNKTLSLTTEAAVDYTMDGETGAFKIKYNNQYLEAGSGNTVRWSNTGDAWTIAISDGKATITSGDYKLNYNPSQHWVAAYTNAQQPVALYALPYTTFDFVLNGCKTIKVVTGYTYTYTIKNTDVPSVTPDNCEFYAWTDGANYYRAGEPITVNTGITLTAVWKEILRGELYEGKWGTFCPQHEIRAFEGASFYTLTYLQMEAGMPYKLFFDEVETDYLEAGKPYLFIAEGEAIKGIKVGDKVTTAANYNGFYGNVSGSTNTISTSQTEYQASGDIVNYYGLKNNTFTLLGNGTAVANERAVVQIKNGQLNCSNPPLHLAPARPGVRRVVASNSAPQIATGVDELNASETPVKMMIDGQLFILRGEKMYDATGRLVK